MSKQSSEHPDDKPRAPGHARRAKPYGLKRYAAFGQTVYSYSTWYATPEARAQARQKLERTCSHYTRFEEIER